VRFQLANSVVYIGTISFQAELMKSLLDLKGSVTGYDFRKAVANKLHVGQDSPFLDKVMSSLEWLIFRSFDLKTRL
jgi:hypothetical protein